MNEYEKYISGRLLKLDYILGKDLNTLLQKKFGVKSDNARKIIERAATAKIVKASAVSFGNRQYSYIHPEKRFTKEIILKITKTNRPPLYRLIMMLDFYKGILPYHVAMKVCATPLKSENTKSDSIAKLVSEMELLEYGIQYKDPTGSKFIVYPLLHDKAEVLAKLEMQSMAVDAAFIPDVLRALRKYNIIDNDKVLYRSKGAPEKGITQNNFVWDAIAYTRTTGINEIRSSEANTFDKQTMVALDIVVNRDYKDEDLQGFVARIQAIQSAVKTGKRKVLPIVVYAKTTTKILIHRIRKLGFLCFDLGSIYGSKVYEIVKHVNDVKTADWSDYFEIDNIVEKTLRVMQDAGQEDNLSNIKGDLFESLMYPLFKLIFSDATIEPGGKLKSKETGPKEYEYDYIITSARLNEVLVIELKGFASSNYISLGDYQTQNTIKWFFGNTFPFAQKILKARHPNDKITACYITTASFKEDGVAFLNSIGQGKLRPNDLDTWYDGEKLMRLLDKYKLKKTSQIIKRYYIKEPAIEMEETDDLSF